MLIISSFERQVKLNVDEPRMRGKGESAGGRGLEQEEKYQADDDI